ncbi:natural cytotoxicity triggering receptor 1 isoform X2 [Ailuropoda melanoleuca]|uniref:natural cytotoxicity triggering receptor 1 isoform X2 n=1 Tax=Ailuropoda melanoleuca TaxID=9646 RepID=UPI001493E4CC|nr:natural cytotoxicity triggering receptor 1 isoform X2 [Ailuropoda melanoleuca]
MGTMTCLYASWSEVEGRLNLLIKSQCESPMALVLASPTTSCASSWPPGLRLHPAAPHSCGSISAMTSTLTALLYLGLLLSQTVSAQEEILSKPIIWAKPDFMIPKGTRVSILCQGTPEAIEYQLYFEGHLSAQRSPKRLGRRSIAVFHIPAMTPHTAGQYKCVYRRKKLWSEPSGPLDLVVTEMYDTPTLSIHPGPEVPSGKNVTFYCRLGTATSTFFLLKEGRSSRPQHRYGNTQVEFSMGPVTTAHRGTYRCFGSYNNYAWSFPSEPVKLLVTDVGGTSLAPTEHTSFSDLWDLDLLTTEAEFQQDLAVWDHTAQNLLQMGLAFLVLVALMCLLAEDCLWGKRTQEKANGASSRQRRGRFRTQRRLDK